jgi:hypothetical protein
MPSRAADRRLRGSRSKEFVPSGLVGTAFASTGERHRTASRNVGGSWTSENTQPGSRRGNCGHARARGLSRSRRQELTVQVGFTLVSLVGTEDWVARNQVSSSPTSCRSSKWCTSTVPTNTLTCPTREAQV